MVSHFTISRREVGSGFPCFIIAEAGVNHNGDLRLAERLVDAAADAGADAVKFQTFKAEQAIIAAAPKAAYQMATTGSAESQLAMVRKLELPFDAFRQLAAHCRDRGIMFLSTPFDNASVDLLATLGVPAFKIPSGELTNPPLLTYVARQGRPLIVSTGMATLDEVGAALRVIEATGNREVALLHCVSNYPADPADCNLRAMATMAAAFGLPVGYSDHTMGIEVSLAAVALGACIIEKHVTLDPDLPGPDHRASLDPTALKALVAGIRNVERALGHGRKEPAAAEADTARVARRSLVAACEIPAGAAITAAMLACKRPGTGLPPTVLAQVVGRHASRTLPPDALIAWTDLD